MLGTKKIKHVFGLPFLDFARNYRYTFFDFAQNLPTIFKLTNLGVNRFGRAYTLFAKSLMS